jgi:MSHA biogenesis protein MshO
MPILIRPRQRGFTLVELIISMVILGILSGIVAMFIARPVQGYIDTARRAALTDTADLALKRMSLEIRTAVPNSVVLAGGGATSTNWVEFIPAYAGGRYCTDSDVCPTTYGDLDFGTADAGVTTFDVLGPPVTVSAGSSMIVFNTGQCSNPPVCSGTTPCTALDAYEGCNRRTVGAAASSNVLTYAGSVFPFASPSNRFQLVSSDGPVAFRCARNELHRYTGYGWTHAVPASSDGLLASSDKLACTFSYSALSAANGLLTITLTLGTSQGETVTLSHQIHVNNMP